jgi:hypothetical protein
MTACPCGFYDDDEIRIVLQPAVAGASMPTWLDISGTKSAELFSMIWFAHASDGCTEVLIDRPGDWEAALRCVALPSHQRLRRHLL